MPLDLSNPDSDRYLLPSTYLFVLDKLLAAATKTAKLCLHGLSEVVRAYYEFKTLCAVYRRRYQKAIGEAGRKGIIRVRRGRKVALHDTPTRG